MSEAVNVDTTGGTPRVAITVGSTTRYANYTSGSGSASLVFTYDAVAGDLDLDGITLTSPVQLNGGTMKDAAGNDAALTFTLPNTSGIRINYPSLSLDFIADSDGRYTRNGTAYNDLSALLAAAGGAFSRAAPATTYAENNAGALVAFAANAPRITDRGLLLEGSRANLQTYSQDLTQWAAINVTRTYSVLAPDGTNTATNIANTPNTGSYLHAPAHFLANSTTYTRSVYAKAVSGNGVLVFESNSGTIGIIATFNLNSGTIGGVNGTATIKSIGGGWYLCSHTFTTEATGSPFSAVYYIGAYGSTPTATTVTIWGAQLEQASFASSYIPTTNSAVTRSADVFHLATTASPQGTFYTEFMPYTAPSGQTIMAYTNNNGVYSTGPGALIRLSSANVASFGGNCCGADTGGTFSAGLTSRLAGSYDTSTNRAAISANGASAVFITNNDFTGTGTARVHFGALNAGGTQQSWGYLRRARIYPAAKSDAELQALTQ